LIVIKLIVFQFIQFTIQINLITSIFTLIILLWYAYDTHRIANQTIETNLRPIILRSGFIDGWKNISFNKKNNNIESTLIEFKILKNIAKDINGFIVLDGKKYQLLFGNNISNIGNNLSRYEQKWGWMENNTYINAIFDNKKYEKSKEKNQIYLNYKDIEGNNYYTKEDENFSQISGKL